MKGAESGASSEVSALVRRPRSSPWPAVDFNDALQIVFDHFSPGAIELLPIQDVHEGRVLAETITAVRPLPEVRTSMKDGYAAIASDGTGLRKVIHKTTAGNLATVGVQSLQVCRVNTGSMVPDGADAVVPVEDTRLVEHDNIEELIIEILSAPKVGQEIRQIGSDIAVGDVLLEKHSVLGSAEMGILAGSLRKTVEVFSRPKVAVMSTGHELVDCYSNHCPLGMVIDTNRPQLLSVFRSTGFKPIDIGIVHDREEDLIIALERAFSLADVVVSSGGVSMGEKDLLKNILKVHFKFDIHFGRVMMKPGLPTTFASGLWKGTTKVVFGLPGNPVSSFVTAHLFVVPALRKVAGWLRYENASLKVKVMEKIRLEQRPEYCRGRFVRSDGDVPQAVRVDSNQISSRLVSTRAANLLIMLPPKSEHQQFVNEGDILDAIVIGQF